MESSKVRDIYEEAFCTTNKYKTIRNIVKQVFYTELNLSFPIINYNYTRVITALFSNVSANVYVI